MCNFVENKLCYISATNNTSNKAIFVFECLMEVIGPNGIELDNVYYAKNLGEFIGGTIPPAILTALVNRGLLHCDGKCDGKNMYAITEEIYDYYNNIYMPSQKAYIEKHT